MTSGRVHITSEILNFFDMFSIQLWCLFKRQVVSVDVENYTVYAYILKLPLEG